MAEISYQVENWIDCKREIIPLVERHFYECNVGDGRKEFSLDEQSMDNMQSLGMLHLTTARNDDGLIGYIVNIIIRPLLHDGKCSYHLGWFVSETHRKSKVGVTLLKKSEEFLREFGVDRMTGMHTDQLDASAVFQRLGWKHIEHHYSKWVN